jgi:hypothetical protein
MKKKQTVQTAVGSATHNEDGTVDLVIDTEKLHNHCMDNARHVLQGIEMAEMSGFLPSEMAARLREVGEAQMRRMEEAHAKLPRQEHHLKYTGKK